MFDDFGGGCDFGGGGGGGYDYGGGCSYNNNSYDYTDDDPLVYAPATPGIIHFNPAAANAGIGFAALAIADAEAAMAELDALSRAANDAMERGYALANNESAARAQTAHDSYPAGYFDDDYLDDGDDDDDSSAPKPSQALQVSTPQVSAGDLTTGDLDACVRIRRATKDKALATLPFRGVLGSDGWPEATPAELQAMSREQEVAYLTHRFHYYEQTKDAAKYLAYFGPLSPYLDGWARGDSVMSDIQIVFEYAGDCGAAGWIEPTEIELCDFSAVKLAAYERIRAYCLSLD